MKIGLIKSYTDKPWRSPETYQVIEDSLCERLQVESIATQDPKVLHEFFLNLGNRNQVFVFNVAEFLDEENKTFLYLNCWKNGASSTWVPALRQPPSGWTRP